MNLLAFFVALSIFRFQRFPDQNDAREEIPQVDRKLRSKYTTSLFRMDRQSIQHTLDLRIVSVMNYIFISFDITLIVLNRPLKLCFKQSYQLILSAYKLRNLSAVITGRPNLIHDFYFVMMLGANRNIRFTWRNFGCIFKLNVSEGK